MGELIIRHIGHYDIDGNFFLGPRRLKPYNFSVKATEERIGQYLSSFASHIMYDPMLGWTPRPKSESNDGLYTYNSDGIRTASADYKVLQHHRRGVLRIAIFGDSFTHGDGVSFENTWGYYLENSFRKKAVDVEVLNFGVGGYGVDQAFLRWKKWGYRFSPQIVIFGFQPENVKRNVNMIRSTYLGNTETPFFKPRYILEKDKLKLINIPTPEPIKLIDIMRNIASWDLIKYEYWYKVEDYKRHIWLKSKLVSFMLYAIEKIFYKEYLEEAFYDLNEEPPRITLDIIKAFKEDVESSGAKFYVVYLPLRDDVVALRNGKKPAYSNLLKSLDLSVSVIHPEEDLFREAKGSAINSLFKGHYRPKANNIVANVISEYILRKKNSY